MTRFCHTHLILTDLQRSSISEGPPGCKVWLMFSAVERYFLKMFPVKIYVVLSLVGLIFGPNLSDTLIILARTLNLNKTQATPRYSLLAPRTINHDTLPILL